MAKELGHDPETISRILKKHGIAVDRCAAQKRLDVERVILMYAQMHTTREIAQQFGVSSKAILKCLRKHGVKIRSRWDYVEK